MPDQHIAAKGHALIQQVAEPLSSLPDDPVALTADADFPTVLRGYDRVAVDAYVRRTSQLAAELPGDPFARGGRSPRARSGR